MGSETRFERELRHAGVEMVDDGRLWLQCLTCWRVWSPDLLLRARDPRSYRRCPSGCNEDKLSRGDPWLKRRNHQAPFGSVISMDPTTSRIRPQAIARRGT